MTPEEQTILVHVHFAEVDRSNALALTLMYLWLGRVLIIHISISLTPTLAVHLPLYTRCFDYLVMPTLPVTPPNCAHLRLPDPEYVLAFPVRCCT